MKASVIVSSLVVGWCLLSFPSPGWGAEIRNSTGTWPHSWPEELEQVRKQSTSYGPPPFATPMFYHIPFHERGQFEEVWPGIAELCQKAVEVKLLDAPECCPAPATKEQSSGFRVAPIAPATVLIIEDEKAQPDANKEITIILFVDGEIIDVNRIRFPSGVAIHDERRALPDKAAVSSGAAVKDASAEQP
jgi:hypothetical protein